jgi:thioredoxin reductase
MRDLVIIGGGAASQAAAVYALDKQIDFVLISDSLGGRVEPTRPQDRDYLVGNILVHFDGPDAEDEDQQLIGSAAVHLFERQLRSQRGRLVCDRVTALGREGRDFLVQTASSGPILAATVIVATGATPQRLDALNGSGYLIADLGHGCTQHGAGLLGQTVAVVGETEQAIYSAAEFAVHARQVYLVLPTVAAAARDDVAVLAARPNITVLAGYEVVEVFGDQRARLLVLQRGDEVLSLDVSAAYMDLGVSPASSLVADLAETVAGGFVRTDSRQATSVPGLFAAGDVSRPEGEQVLTAIGDGARAARSAHFYLLTRAVPSAVAVAR